MSELSLSKDKIHILLLEGVHQVAVENFKRAGYTNIRYEPKALPGDELKAALSKAHYVGLRSRTQLKGDALDAAEKLVAVGAFCIGTNQIDLDVTRERGIPVFNAPHANTRSVAELMIAEMVMLYRGLGDKNAAAHEGRWLKSAAGSYELRGKSVGIVGYGHIGSQVSILAEAFGMTVKFYDIAPKLSMGNAEQIHEFHTLLGSVDFVSLHVPDTPQTRGMMGRAEIEAMKPGACLLNASRGTVVDIDALADALDSGHISGAAVDVFPKEPKSPQERFESPLQGKANVILTPHIGGSTQEAQFNIGRDVSSKLVQYSDNGDTVGAVNFPQLSLPGQGGSAHRLLHIHENRPGILSAINKAIAEREANIKAQYLQTLPEVGYVVMDVERGEADPLRDVLRNIPGTIRCRVLF
ncbi:MAG: phosphoglycerate dehydrogenase [Bradymonadia bacterium]